MTDDPSATGEGQDTDNLWQDVARMEAELEDEDDDDDDDEDDDETTVLDRDSVRAMIEESGHSEVAEAWTDEPDVDSEPPEHVVLEMSEPPAAAVTEDEAEEPQEAKAALRGAAVEQDDDLVLGVLPSSYRRTSEHGIEQLTKQAG